MKDSDWLTKAAASAFGLGHLPVAPGTWASAAAGGVYVFVCEWLPPAHCVAVVAALSVAALCAGLAVCRRACAAYGEPDPRHFVLDELAGQWLTYFLLLPAGSPVRTALLGFVAFRFFDIAKPFPVCTLERLPGAWGVMADDLAAAVYAALVAWAGIALKAAWLG